MLQAYHGTRNRRKNPDRFIRIINIIVFMSILLAVVIFLIAFSPAAHGEFLGVRNLERIFGEPLQKNMLRTAFYLMIAQFCLSAGGFVLSMFYHKRRSDRYHYSLVVFGALSLAGIIIYMYFT